MATKTQGLRIRTKLLGMVLMLVFFSITVGAISFYGLSKVTQKFQPHLVPALEAAHNLETALSKIRLLEKDIFVSIKDSKQADFRKKQQQSHEGLLAIYKFIADTQKDLALGDYDNEFSRQQVRTALANDVRTSYNGTMNTLRPLSKAISAGKDIKEVSSQLTLYQKSFSNLESSITKIKKHLIEALDDQKQASIAFEADKILIMLGAGLGIVLIGFIVGSFFSSRLTKALDTLMQGIEAVGKGEFTEISITSKDEFAEIAKAFNETANQVKAFVKTDDQRQATEENVINFLEVVSEASEGDLTLRAPVTEDAFGTIADSYNLMIESLADLLTDTTINAEEVGEESRQLLEIFQVMKEGADKQLTYVSSATDAAEETAASATQIAEKTALAQSAATSVEDATNLGNERVNRNIEGMQLIRVTVQVINKKMKTLAERLLEIGTISQLISDVATRTTILAMNASIEASRAGEQGRGFLVISDEIKRLADEASEATRQIGGIIKSIQSEANEVTLALEEETSTVEEQTKIAQETGEALAAINKATSDSKQVVTEITKLSQEQQQISDGMVTTIRQMADITAETSAMITTTSQISEGLNGVSESLLQSLGQFRLSPAEEEVVENNSEPEDIVNETFLTPEEQIFGQDTTTS